MIGQLKAYGSGAEHRPVWMTLLWVSATDCPFGRSSTGCLLQAPGRSLTVAGSGLQTNFNHLDTYWKSNTAMHR